MKTFNAFLLPAFLSLASLRAEAGPVWSSTSTVQTILSDGCSGTTVTAVYLTGDSKVYYFLDTAPNAKQMLSLLETAFVSGTNINIKYESNSNNPGTGCTFNPGHIAYVVSVNP